MRHPVGHIMRHAFPVPIQYSEVNTVSIIMHGQELQADCCCNWLPPSKYGMSHLHISRLCKVLSSASLVELLHLHYESTALDAVDKDVTALEACIM